eukprot:2844462-Prymnesium_polylepis.1
MSHLALILVYTCVLAIKTCELSRDVCNSYGFGSAEGARFSYTRRTRCMDSSLTRCVSAAGLFVFFIFFAFAMCIFQLVFEAAAVSYHIRMQSKLRRLRYRGG